MILLNLNCNANISLSLKVQLTGLMYRTKSSVWLENYSREKRDN